MSVYPCERPGDGCARPAVQQTWLFVPDGICKPWLCAECLEEFTQNGHDRTASELGKRAADGEPPEGYEVVVVGGKLDGQRYHRRDSTHPLLVALGSAAQWWDEHDALQADWAYRKREAERGGGRLEVVT